jgi:hypothetical protein
MSSVVHNAVHGSLPAGLRHKALPPRHVFLAHVFRNAAIGLVLILAALGLGALGYHAWARLPWIDALLNAAMILTGMGPVSPLPTIAAKLFASAYALFSGVAFLTFVAVLFGPVAQRLLHRFHLELYESAEAQKE